MHAPTQEPQVGAVKFTMLLAGVVLLLMMVLGVVMRAAQAGMISVNPSCSISCSRPMVPAWSAWRD